MDEMHTRESVPACVGVGGFWLVDGWSVNGFVYKRVCVTCADECRVVQCPFVHLRWDGALLFARWLAFGW